MAEIYGSHFEYAGVSSRQYNLVFATVESARNMAISGTIGSETVYDKKNIRQYLLSTDYKNNPLSFEVEIVSEDASDLDVFTRRDIEKWLFNRHNYRRLYLDIDDDCYGETIEILRGLKKRLYLNCRFINARRLESDGGVMGYAATLEADTGFWWQEEVTYTYTPDNQLTDSVSLITVHADIDIDDYVYPTVSFTMGDFGGLARFINNSDVDTRFTTFDGLSVYDTVLVNGSINYVSGAYYEKFTNKNFPRLLDGDNIFTVQGNIASVSFSFQNRRYL